MQHTYSPLPSMPTMWIGLYPGPFGSTGRDTYSPHQSVAFVRGQLTDFPVVSALKCGAGGNHLGLFFQHPNICN